MCFDSVVVDANRGGCTGFSAFCATLVELMRDPVFAVDGNTYERVAIEQWLSTGARTSPTTNEPLENLTLIPNHMARRMITALLEERRARD